jgi:hypothetical protein
MMPSHLIRLELQQKSSNTFNENSKYLKDGSMILSFMHYCGSEE